MTKVFMYTLSTCPWCRKAKRFFAERGIPYEYIDYDTTDDDEQARIIDEMVSQSGIRSFPYVRIGDYVIVGWNPKKYAELLGLDEDEG